MTNPKTSTVALFSAAGQPFDLRVAPIPSLKNGELLVKIESCTVCGSDLHTYAGHRQSPIPAILGHEILGRLVSPQQVDDGEGRSLRAGERLIWSVTGSCNHCFFCETGIPQKCESAFKYGHEPFSQAWPLNGGLAEYCVVRPGTFFLRAPDNIAAGILTPTSCATATVAAALQSAGPLRGKHVLVMGAGMLGTTACAMLDSLGATVATSDLKPLRLRHAQLFGSSRELDAGVSIEDFTAEARSATKEHGFDVVLEVAGHNASVERALSACRIGGTCVLAGSVFPQNSLSVSSEDIVRRMLTIRGVHNYAPGHLLKAREFLTGEAHRYPFESLIEAKFPLDAVNSAFPFALEIAPYRVMVCPNQDLS